MHLFSVGFLNIYSFEKVEIHLYLYYFRQELKLIRNVRKCRKFLRRPLTSNVRSRLNKDVRRNVDKIKKD